MEQHLRVDLGMTMAAKDVSAFFERKKKREMIGLVVSYVDDLLSAVTGPLDEESKQTSRISDAKPKFCGRFTFAGVTLQHISGGMLLHQTSYATIIRLRYSKRLCMLTGG